MDDDFVIDVPTKARLELDNEEFQKRANAARGVAHYQIGNPLWADIILTAFFHPEDAQAYLDSRDV